MRPFVPADLADFHRHHRQFAKLFVPGGVGPQLWAIANNADALLKMTVVNDAVDLPAVTGLAKEFWPFLTAAASPADRKELASAMGGMVRTVMVANARSTTGTKRAVPPVMINGVWERVFKTGEMYA